MLYRIVTSFVLMIMTIVLLSACGANSPSGNTGLSGKTALTMTVNFPARGAVGGLSGLISPNTQTIEIRVSNGATFNPLAIIASTTIAAPAGGGPVTATLVVSNPGPVVSVSIISRDALGNWLGEVQELNKPIKAGGTTPIGAVMVEIGQGIDLAALGIPPASRPVVYAPDGTAYTVGKVFITSVTTASGSVFNLNAECEMVASGAIAPVIVIRDTAAPGTFPPVIRTSTAASNGAIAGTVAFFNQGSATISKDYIFTLLFNTNNTFTLNIAQSAGGLPAPAPLNTSLNQSWTNSVVTMGTYYVNAATGSDLNPGTLTAPWKTITHAIASAPAGIIDIKVAPGTYDTINGEVFPIILKNGQSMIGNTANKGVGAASTTVVGKGIYTITGGKYAWGWSTTLVIPPNVTATVSGFDVAGAFNGILVDKGMAVITYNTIKNQLGSSDSLTILNGGHANIAFNDIQTTGWCSVGLHDPTTSAILRNNIITSLAGSGGDAVEISTNANVDLGTAANPGNNTILGASTSVGLNILSTTASMTVTAVGNTWKPNIQGADAAGHYAAALIPAGTPYAGGMNYANPSTAGPGIQFFSSLNTTSNRR